MAAHEPSARTPQRGSRIQAPELVSWRCALLLLRCEPEQRDDHLAQVRAAVGELPHLLADPLLRCVAAAAEVPAELLPATLDAEVAALCALLDTATGHDPLGGGLALRDERLRVERLRTRLATDRSPWTGAVDAVCATLGPGRFEMPAAAAPGSTHPARVGEGASPVRVFLLDDHEVVRSGLRGLLEGTGEFEVVGESGSAARATAIIPALRPDVAVLDVRLPDGSGMEVCRDVRSVDPSIRMLILTSYDDDDALFTAILAGAAGYVLKQASSKELIDAVRLVATGRSLIDPTLTARVFDRLRAPEPEVDALVGITDREREILELIADGMTNRQIGEQLCLAEKTVKNYVSTLLGKLGLERRTQAAVLATRLRR